MRLVFLATAAAVCCADKSLCMIRCYWRCRVAGQPTTVDSVCPVLPVLPEKVVFAVARAAPPRCSASHRNNTGVSERINSATICPWPFLSVEKIYDVLLQKEYHTQYEWFAKVPFKWKKMTSVRHQPHAVALNKSTLLCTASLVSVSSEHQFVLLCHVCHWAARFRAWFFSILF